MLPYIRLPYKRSVVYTNFVQWVSHLVEYLGWVDLHEGVSLAGGQLLLLPIAKEGWRNTPNLSQPNRGI